ncbi:MAG: leucine--tRNA ligase [Patescibacteria group bacterium]
MKEYNHKKIESKWKKVWDKKKIFKTDASPKEKCYVLDMFPYPSGDGLHVGHPKGYIATDVYSRYKKAKGFSILHPMGWDAFGLPAENFAIKNKIHPEIAVKKNVNTFKKQLEVLGFNYDWNREINTTDPEYYKWTQLIFLEMFKRGLAYESFEPINWCPSCKTGLANEDLEDGKCERCGSVIEKKPMRQWVLKITDYAERLLEDLNLLNWSDSIKESQRNWIGKSEGMIFTSPIKGTDIKIETFSAHFEAFAADTFVVIAPDHPLLPKLLEGIPNKKEILDFSARLVKNRSEAGFKEQKEVEGIFTGRYTIDPVENGELPIWVASYALADYGTGIVKCSAHDERDFKFAKKYKIPLKPVLFPADSVLAEKVRNLEICFTDMKSGVLKNPKEFDGKVAGNIRNEIIKYLEKNKLAKRKTTYKLRDWVFSRQRYWGEPIPLVFCVQCKKRAETQEGRIEYHKNFNTGELLNPGWIAIPDEDLPVKLPKVKSYEPSGTGESPLANIASFVNIKCPKCGGKAQRETNTMPQWAGSSWYYAAYAMKSKTTRSTGLLSTPVNGLKAKTEKGLEQFKSAFESWLPVDMYIGGAEHATRHLIYARFWHKFLYDMKIFATKEPFMRFKNVGLIMAPDGRKMSKRFGNVINPDEIVATWGADTLRVYEMFMGPFENAIAWDTQNMIGSRRFLEKIWRLQEKVTNKKLEVINSDLQSLLHQTIKKVGEDIENFNFNTAISSLMILAGALENQEKISKEIYETVLQLISPFAPHITEELWANLGNKKSIYLSPWPMFDSQKIKQSSKLAIQINGKTRDIFEMESEMSEKDIKEKILDLPSVKKWIEGKEVKRIIYVKGKILNIVL